MTEMLEVVGPAGVRRFSHHEVRELGRGGRTPVREFLPEDGEVTHVSFETATADYRASIPLEVVRQQGVIVHSDESGPLRPETGGPFRLLVVDGDTLCWNVKAVARIRLTVGPEPDSVPENPPH